MTDIQETKKKYLADWLIEPVDEDIGAYENILDHILMQPSHHMNHMAFSSFHQIAEQEVDAKKLLQWIFYLINIAELLDLKYEFIDDNDESYKLTADQLDAAKQMGEFHHPYTGDVVSEFQDKVFMYFVPSSKLLNLKDCTSQSNSERE